MEFSPTDTTGVFLPLVYFFPEPTQFMIYVTAQTKLNSVFVIKSKFDHSKFHAPLEEMTFLISLQLQSEKAFSLGG